MATIQTFKGSVRYSELKDSHKYSYIGNIAKLTRDFKVAWEDRHAFIVAMMGSATIENISSSRPKIVRKFPQGYSDYFSTQNIEPFLFPTSIELVEGMAMRGDAITGTTPKGIPCTRDRSEDPFLYREARVRLGYEALTYKVNQNYDISVLSTSLGDGEIRKGSIGDAERYITKIIQPMLEVIRLPIGYFSWAEGYIDKTGKTIAQPGQGNITGCYRVKATAEITYTWHMIPALPKEGWYREDINNDGDPNTPELVGSLFTHLGCLNHNWFDGYAPGTLLLKGAEARPYKWVDGRRYYDYVWHIQHFQPLDVLEQGASIVRKIGGINIERPTTSKPGHNYFLRLQYPKREQNANNTQAKLECEPHFELLTHNGLKGGKPLFAYRDFNDLFIPMNKRHMIDYYSAHDLNPEL